jgi:type IV pilus assembly protein PilB
VAFVNADSPPKRPHVPIGKYFLQQGKITPEQLESALAYKQQHGARLGQALVALKFVSEDDLITVLREQGKVHCINLTPEIIDPEVAMKLGENESRRFQSIAMNQIARYTTVAMEDPSDVLAIDELGRRLQTRILPVFAEPSKISQVIESVFTRGTIRLGRPEASRSVDLLAETARQEAMVDGPEAFTSGKDVDLTASDTRDEDGEKADLDKPVINLVRSVLQEAFLQGASDIHMEPRRNDFLIRFRVDGVLFDRTNVPKSWARPVLARLKVMAKLDIAQRRLPQDGRCQFSYKGNRVDLRIATTPCLHGEGVVLRILDGGRQLHDLESLDLDEGQRKTLERIITCRDGFVVATGPTGSGKTTTLYAMLQRLNSRDRKIITLEDPVENEMEGVTQINANPKIGLTFAAGLRSILRQDPDIVLLGEIRDEETAEIAVQASLTGHIVLSTLHTVGAAESITRLADMGVEPYHLADTLRGIVAQRLLRRICTGCKSPHQTDPETLHRLGIDDPTAQFYEGRGCEHCNGTGFKGRIGIYEIMQMTQALCRLVEKGEGTDNLHQAALQQGMVTLREDGLRKARAGLTPLSEVLAATSRG